MAKRANEIDEEIEIRRIAEWKKKEEVEAGRDDEKKEGWWKEWREGGRVTIESRVQQMIALKKK